MAKKNNRKKLSQKTRFAILVRDNHTCQYCGAKAPDVVLHVDHMMPVCEGGTNDSSNLITACQSCNAGKSGIDYGFGTKSAPQPEPVVSEFDKTKALVDDAKRMIDLLRFELKSAQAETDYRYWQFAATLADYYDAKGATAIKPSVPALYEDVRLSPFAAKDRHLALADNFKPQRKPTITAFFLSVYNGLTRQEVKA